LDVRVVREDPRSWDDGALLAAVAAGDGAAFAVFYRRHLAGVLAYLMRQTRDPETAGDLAAEVFSAVLLQAGRYRPEGPSALPWVVGIARHKLLMSLRRGRVEARARERLGLEPVELQDADLERIEALAGTGHGRLEQLVGGLPPAEREAVLGRVVEDRSYREIAADLRCSEMVVRKRVSRGLSRLRQNLKEANSA
jgi:RNA polymerase sigma-70 factor (ECF subfamily)